tara:strand:- start:5761 stop:5982 length:222 start_codon:yes stop_codon:yes gene_type:complete
MNDETSNISEKSFLVTLLLCIFTGFGHKFYIGRPGSAFGMFFTAAGLGIWYIYDIINIARGEMVDGSGKKIKQ